MGGRGESAALLMALPLAVAAQPQWGLQARLQGEQVSDDRFGEPGGRAETVGLLRLLLDAGWRADTEPRPAAFVQFGLYAAQGRNGGASSLDASDPDLYQAWLELPLGDSGGRLRLGRQEWSLGSGRLLSVRDGPNARRAFDAAQLDTGRVPLRLRLLYGRPVRNGDGAFDDRRDPDQRLSGAVLGTPALGGVAELYSLHYERREGRYAVSEGQERRESFGLRLAGGEDGPGWRHDLELVWQQGRVADTPVRAWTLASDTGYRFTRGPGRPQLGLKLDLASGDRDPDDGRLETFNALYPNPSYFSDAALIAPANLIDLQPYLQWSASATVTLRAGWNAVWKHRRADAIYGTPVPLRPLPVSTGGPRFVGHQPQLGAEWAVTEAQRISLSYVHFEAGAGLRAAGGGDVDFLQLVLSLEPR